MAGSASSFLAPTPFSRRRRRSRPGQRRVSGSLTRCRTGTGTAAGRRGAPRPSTPGRCSASHSRRCAAVSGDRRALALDDGDDLVVVGDQLGRAAPAAAPASVGADGDDAVAADEPEPVALGDRPGVAGRVAHGPGDLAGDDAARPRRAIAAALSSAPSPRGRRPRARRSPRRSPVVGTTRTVLAVSASTCSATGMMFLLLGRITTSSARRRLDGLEQLGGRRVHRLAAGDDCLHAERAEDAAGCRRRWRRRRPRR